MIIIIKLVKINLRKFILERWIKESFAILFLEIDSSVKASSCKVLGNLKTSVGVRGF